MEIARLFFESDKLNGSENYTSWSFKVKTILKRNEAFDEVVASGPPAVTPTGEALKEREKKKIKAISIFQVMVKDHLIPTVREYEDNPHGLWEHLKRRFESSAIQRKLVLTRKLSNLRMSESNSVEQYIRSVDDVRNELASIVQKVDELDLIYSVLGGLPLSWGPFVSTFGAELNRTPPPTYGDLVERLTTENYWRSNQRTHGNTEEALFAARNCDYYSRGKSNGGRNRFYRGRRSPSFGGNQFSSYQGYTYTPPSTYGNLLGYNATHGNFNNRGRGRPATAYDIYNYCGGRGAL